MNVGQWPHLPVLGKCGRKHGVIGVASQGQVSLERVTSKERVIEKWGGEESEKGGAAQRTWCYEFYNPGSGHAWDRDK